MVMCGNDCYGNGFKDLMYAQLFHCREVQFGKAVHNFGVYHSSSAYVDNRKKNILILGKG